MTRFGSWICAILVMASGSWACGGRSTLLDDGDTTTDGGAGGTSTSTSPTSSSTGVMPGPGGSGGTGGSGGATMTNPVISESPMSVIESEVSVAAAPDGRVVAAWISVGQNGDSFIGYAFSTDDGLSWQPPSVAVTPGGRVGADPVLAVDATGNIYLTWIGYFYGNNGPVDMHVYVARADAGDSFFGPAVEASNPAKNADYDKPWIAITPMGAVFVSYLEETNGGMQLAIASSRSVDGGNTFSQQAVAPNTYGNLAFPCSSPTSNRMWVTYVRFTNQVEIALQYSDDDGITWPAVNQSVASSEPDVAFVDPNCTANGNDLWVSYGLTNEMLTGEDTQGLHTVRVVHSSNGGVSFDAMADAQDNAAANVFLLPEMARDAANRLHLTYFAGKNDQDNQGSFRRVQADDLLGGFSPSVEIEVPLLFLQSRVDPQWLGDYTGLATRNGTLYAAFPVNTSGLSHISFFRTQLPQ